MFSGGSIFDNSNIGGSIFDSPQQSSSSIFSKGNSTPSIFSSQGEQNNPFASSVESSNNESLFMGKGSYMNENSNAHALNVRAQRYGDFSIVDKMRGVIANKRNLDGDSVSLAESYSDKSLDKRAMGGLYNVTITDIYQDSAKFQAHHGLFADGFVSEAENVNIETDSVGPLGKKDNPLIIQIMVEENPETGTIFSKKEENISSQETTSNSFINKYIGSNNETEPQTFFDKYKNGNSSAPTTPLQAVQKQTVFGKKDEEIEIPKTPEEIMALGLVGINKLKKEQEESEKQKEENEKTEKEEEPERKEDNKRKIGTPELEEDTISSENMSAQEILAIGLISAYNKKKKDEEEEEDLMKTGEHFRTNFNPESFYITNKKTNEDEEEDILKKAKSFRRFRSGNFGVYDDNDLSPEELKQLKAGGQGVYGEASLEEELGLIEKIREIYMQMDSLEIIQTIQELESLKKKTHKDFMKIKIGKDVLSEKNQSLEFDSPSKEKKA